LLVEELYFQIAIDPGRRPANPEFKFYIPVAGDCNRLREEKEIDPRRDNLYDQWINAVNRR
jgi:hypothetical protein